MDLETRTAHALPFDLFVAEHVVGRVFQIDPTSVKLNLLPMSEDLPAPCEVGDFVVMRCRSAAVVGKITRVELPHDERLAVETGADTPAMATAQLLTSADLARGSVAAGVAEYPSLGTLVYAVEPTFVKWLAEQSDHDRNGDSMILDIATLPDGTPAGITPERLFGRHCAIVGATGGGKSWTLARLVESSARFKAKMILIDPTGEYHTIDSGVVHVSLGGPDHSGSSPETVFPYRQLVEDDLIALFRPDSRVQLARMRAAIKSLKLAAIVGPAHELVAGNGCIPKAQQSKGPFEAAYSEHIEQIETPRANFDVALLPTQIRFECIFPTAGATPSERARWGDVRIDELTECDALMARIESHLAAPEYACIFQGEGASSLTDVINAFLNSEDRVLRVSLRQLAFTQSTREIVVNAIGRFLLELAREGGFAEQPLVVLVDEAHQFLNQQIGEQWWTHSLDAFELLAKEGRKYALTVCLATQRPRDIPEGVLSQMGTFVVHRLISDSDRSLIERASGEIDRDAAQFLPTLSSGQAVLVGVDLPMPLTLQIRPPARPPDSGGPDYQTFWR